MTELTKKEAYLAMYSFLENRYNLTGSDDIAGLLGSMALLQDGTSADSVCWDDWEESIIKIKVDSVNADITFAKQ